MGTLSTQVINILIVFLVARYFDHELYVDFRSNIIQEGLKNFKSHKPEKIAVMYADLYIKVYEEQT